MRVFGDANAFVLDTDFDVVLVTSVICMDKRDRYSNGTSQWAVFYRVLQQVAEDLVKTNFVSFNQIWAVGSINAATNFMLCKRSAVTGNSFLSNIFQIKRLQVQCNLSAIEPCYF